MSRRGVIFVAPSGSGLKNYGEKKIMGYTEKGEGVSLRIQGADVQKVLGTVHKMNMGGNVVVLDGRARASSGQALQEETIPFRTGWTCSAQPRRSRGSCRNRRSKTGVQQSD